MKLITIAHLLIAAGPLLHLIAATVNWRRPRWGWSRFLSGVAFLAVAAGSVLLLGQSGVEGQPSALIAKSYSLLIATMIGLLGVIVIRFSKNYLAGEPGTRRYLQMLHAALAAISVTVLTDHIGVLLVGWAFISFALHELLLFYPDRKAATIAARKKFLMARLAELSLFAGALLLVNHHGVWSINAIVSAYPKALGGTETLAAVLIAVAALIKCAQLPTHGWLIQVVEAPTPVSALLHAGIINLGGYLLLLFGPLVLSAWEAQAVVLVVAGLTVVVASLEMARQRAVKVRLAWSTGAQMGLMLVEAALGLYELALLHLIAHSFYKAYLFLRSGSAVEQHEATVLAARARPRLRHYLLSSVVGFGLAIAAAVITNTTAHASSWILIAAFASVALSQVPLAAWTGAVLYAALAVAAFAIQMMVFGNLVGHADVAARQLSAADVLVAFLFVYLWMHWMLDSRHWSAMPNPVLQQYRIFTRRVDEALTQATYRLWSASDIPAPPESLLNYSKTAEVD